MNRFGCLFNREPLDVTLLFFWPLLALTRHFQREDVYFTDHNAAALEALRAGCITRLTHGLFTKRQYLPMPYAPTLAREGIYIDHNASMTRPPSLISNVPPSVFSASLGYSPSSSSAYMPVKGASLSRILPLTASDGCGMISATFQLGRVPLGCTRLIVTRWISFPPRTRWACPRPPNPSPSPLLHGMSYHQGFHPIPPPVGARPPR